MVNFNKNDINKATCGKFPKEVNTPKTVSTIQYEWMLNNPMKELRFSGGEPFFDSQVVSLLKRYVDKGWAKDTILAYHTNGTLLHEHIDLSLIHISEPTRPERIGSGVFFV